MTNLHLISHPVNLEQFQIEMARLTSSNDEILFIGDSVISLMNKDIATYLQQSNIQYHALAADCLCRGINQLMIESIKQISDSEMVDLTIKHQQIVSW